MQTTPRNQRVLQDGVPSRLWCKSLWGQLLVPFQVQALEVILKAVSPEQQLRSERKQQLALALLEQSWSVLLQYPSGALKAAGRVPPKAPVNPHSLVISLSLIHCSCTPRKGGWVALEASIPLPHSAPIVAVM